MRTAAELLARYVNQHGKVERAVATEGWIRPSSVEVSGDDLIFDFREPLQRIKPGATMMVGFLKLADAPNEHIVAYAKRWGALGKSPIDSHSGQPAKQDERFPGFWNILHGRTESLATWRSISKQVKDLLSQAADLDRM